MKTVLPFVLSAVWFFVNFATLSHYGINWDAPMQMMRGQAFAEVFLTGNRSYGLSQRSPSILIGPNEFASRYYFLPAERGTRVVSTDKLSPQEEYHLLQEQLGKRISFYRDETWNSAYFLQNDGPGHMPLVDILSAFANRLFYERLGWLGDIESYQLVYLVGSALGIFVVTRFAIDITNSLFAGLVAGLSLGFFPLFIAESHINMKDPWQASMVGGAMWALWHFMKTRRSRWFVGLVLFIAGALGVKWNIGVFPITVGLWFYTLRRSQEVRHWNTTRLFIFGSIGAIGIVGALIAIWPYAWIDPLVKLWSVLGFYLEHGFDRVRLQPPGFLTPGGLNIFPWVALFTQTPEIVLALVSIATVGLLRRNAVNPINVRALLLFWILVPLIRVSLPNASFYGGLRQVMEILPMLAILAGIGAYDVIRRFERKRKKIVQAGLIAIYIVLFFIITTYHPNENAYFNALAGGVSGAAKRNLVDWTLSWGTLYKQGADWLNQYAEKNARIAHIDGTSFALSPLWLRDDITISPDNFSGFGRRGEYILTLYNPLDPPVFAKRYIDRFLVPVHTIDIDGIPLLLIYKNETEFSQKIQENILPADELSLGKGRSPDGASFWQLDLGRDYEVSRIVIDGAPVSCTGGFASNEYVLFVPDAKKREPITLSNAFVFHEKRVDEDGRITYFFPGEQGRFIFVYPQHPDSCFEQGKVREVGVLAP